MARVAGKSTKKGNTIYKSLNKWKMIEHWNVFQEHNILDWDDVDSGFCAVLKETDEKLLRLVDIEVKKAEQSKVKKEEQSRFEVAVKLLRENKKGTVKFDFMAIYGKDPQKVNSDLGKRKLLPRLCSKHVNGDELAKYIGNGIRFNYCVGTNGKNCCEDLDRFTFNMRDSFNLSEQIIRTLYPGSLTKIFEESMSEYLITDKNGDCILDIDGFQLYIRTITQDALSSGMESRQNANRISYAKDTAYIFFGDKVMRIKCPRIGIGYFDLPNHVVNERLNTGCNVKGDEHCCIHRMIHIHKDFLKDVYIDFGFKHENASLNVKLTNQKLNADYGGSIVLLSRVPSPVLPLQATRSPTLPPGSYHGPFNAVTVPSPSPTLPFQAIGNMQSPFNNDFGPLLTNTKLPFCGNYGSFHAPSMPPVCALRYNPMAFPANMVGYN